MNYTDKQLLDKVKSLPDFQYIPNDYWLIFVRSKADNFDQFDDYAFLYKGEEFKGYSTCTTNPGGPILLGGWKKYTKSGAAIIKSNQWGYKAFKYGLHAGKMKALRQVKELLYHRDANNDRHVDETSKIEKAIYNTNIHFDDYNIFHQIKLTIKRFIGNWSAGCIVFNEQTYYENLIKLTEKQEFVTICLLKEF